MQNTVRSKTYLPLIALCLGFLMVIIDVTIVNVALPDMAKNLKGNISWLQWVVDGYTLTFACLLLSIGNLADRIGAKNTFVIGLLLFVLTSTACGLTINFLQLTICRLLQGFSAAMIVPTSLALLNASYDKDEERANAIGIWAGIGGIGAAAGPVLGGILTSYFGWRAIFFVNIPIGVCALIFATNIIKNPRSGGSQTFDFMGQLLGIISISAVSFSLIEAGRLGWFSYLVILGFIIFVITLILFILVEHRSKDPMLPLKIFRSRTFSIAIFTGMALNIASYGEPFVLSLYFQQIRHYSVFLTGFAFLPFMGVIAITSYVGGKIISASGPKIPMSVGLAIGAIGFLWLLITSEYTPYGQLILPLIIVGVGVALIMPAATVAAIHSAPADKAGIASGTLNASRQLGSLIGVAIFGTIINRLHDFMMGMHLSLIISSLLYICTCMVVLLGIKTNNKK